MFVAVVGVAVVGVIGTAAAHDDHRNHSNHRNYSDSSLRNEIARMDQEVQDLERKISRMKNDSDVELEENYASVMDSVRQSGLLSREISDGLVSGNGAENHAQSIHQVSEALRGLVNKEQERLKAIDKTIARINQIELESGDEKHQKNS